MFFLYLIRLIPYCLIYAFLGPTRKWGSMEWPMWGPMAELGPITELRDRMQRLAKVAEGCIWPCKYFAKH